MMLFGPALTCPERSSLCVWGGTGDGSRAGVGGREAGGAVESRGEAAQAQERGEDGAPRSDEMGGAELAAAGGAGPARPMTDSDAHAALLALQDFLGASGLGAYLSISRREGEADAGQAPRERATETSVHLPSGAIMSLAFQPGGQPR